MAASSLSASSLKALEITLADALMGRTGVAVVPRAYHDALASGFPSGRLVDGDSNVASGVSPDVLVIDDVLDHSNGQAVLARALALVRADGKVVARLSPEFAPGLLREQVTEHLVDAFPSFSFRLVDLTSPHWIAVRARKPVAWLILGASKSGKTSSTIELAQRTGLPSIHGDALLEEIALDLRPATSALKAVARAGYETQNWAISINALFDDGVIDEFLSLVVDSAGGGPFFFEMWVPIEHRHRVHEHIDRQGYFTFKPDVDAVSQALDFADRLRHAEAALSTAQQRSKELEARLAELSHHIAALQASRSWRLTAPLRAVSLLFRRG